MRSIKNSVFCLLLVVISFSAKSQGSSKKELVPKNWHQLDKTETGYYGISLEKAYQLVKGKNSQNVVVAVIDSGIDTLHEDIKPVLWRNPKEIPGNRKDDDKNGYTDDVYGWNFIGGKDGRNVKQDSYEGARVYHKLKAKYGDIVPDTSSVTPQERAEIEMYQKAQEKILGSIDPRELLFMKRILPGFKKGDSIISMELGKEEFSCADLVNYLPTDVNAKNTKNAYLGICKLNNDNDITNKQILNDLEGQVRKGESVENAPQDYRGEIVKDDETDINDRYYGNNDVMAGTPFHGTHCSGIIAAARNNGKGVDGIADNVKIMMIRAVPDGDEHDKDIANAIRYAVDNGAKIISMSFGKDFSPEKIWVDDAVKYAESKDVLLVHAAGNDAKNIDSADNFPNPVFADGKGRSNTFITVGASGDPSNGGITANFSNYGKNEVDVFAPGVKIYSTIPGGNAYGNASGTSMAGPVVAGTAAFLLSYYPNLSAKQLKYIIEKSATPLTEKVNLPASEEKVYLTDISKSGGLLNAYEATKLAAELTGERIAKPEIDLSPKMMKKKGRG